MTLKKKILLGFVGMLGLAIVSGAVLVSYTTDCPAAPATPQGDTIAAIRQRCYGGPEVLSYERVAKPVPGDDQLLVRVRAVSVNPAEWHGMTGKPYLVHLAKGYGAPRDAEFGADYSGVVEAVGKSVTKFKVGDEIFGGRTGSFAEYIVAKESGSVVLKPANITFEQAAGIPIAAVTALQALRDHGALKAGEKVLINGASGGVGTFAVQIAKAMGAEVTAVCSTRNLELVRVIGADHVVDYTRENFTEGSAKYDLILDNVGTHSLADMSKVMNPGARVIMVGGPKTNPWFDPMWNIAKGTLHAKLNELTFKFFVAQFNVPDFEYLASLARDGKMTTVIDRTYPLSQTREAMAYLGTQRARGKVIVTVGTPE
jgi:NADPH:quinone reductase-like Zn-dependent oxidoreductase